MRLMFFATVIMATAPMSAEGAIVDVFQYRLGEAGTLGTNNLPLDSTGNGYNETNTNGTGSTSVQSSSPPPTLNSSTAYLDFNPNRGFFGASVTGLPTDNFAVELWLRPDSSTGALTAFRIGGPDGSLNFRTVDGDVRMSYDNISGIHPASQFSPPLGEWTHLAVVRNSGISTAYVNGNLLIGSSNHTPNWAGTIHIGMTGGGAQHWNGAIDEIRMYTFDPNSDDPTAAFNIGVVPEPSGIALAIACSLLIGVVAYRSRTRA